MISQKFERISVRVPKKAGADKAAYGPGPPIEVPDIPRPKSPKPIKQPKLIHFQALDPIYAGECKEKPYEEIKMKIGEDEVLEKKIKYGKDVPWGPAKDKPLPKTHPCFEQRTTKYRPDGLFGSKFKASGKYFKFNKANFGVHHDTIFQCKRRAGARKKFLKKLSWGWWSYNQALSIGSFIGQQICMWTGKGIVIAPFGKGIHKNLAKMCNVIRNTAIGITKLARGVLKKTSQEAVSHLMSGDCDYLSQGLKQTICDLHCIRDATVKGDFVINHNIEQATKNINTNVAAMSKWGVDSLNQRADFISEEIGWLNDNLKKKIQALSVQIAGNAHPELLQLTDMSRKMIADMQGFTDSSVLSATARRAAHQFLQVHKQITYF